MADQSSNCPPPNPTQNHTNNKPISSFLGSPRIFNGLLTRSLSDIETIKISWGRLYDTETVTSPNSILDGMHNLNIGNPFGYDRKSPNPITKKPPTINTTTKNTSQFQTSRGRLYGAKCVVSPNSTLDEMQNHNLGNPFGYDKKPPNPITKKPSINQLESETSQGRLYDVEVGVSPNSTLDGMQSHNLGNPFGYDRKQPKPITKKPPANKLKSETTETSRGRLYDAIVGPNSILDGMQNHNLGNPFGYDRKQQNPITKMHPNNKLESESLGLALIDPTRTSETSPVLFGAKLKVEIPCSIEVKNSTCGGDFGEMESSEDYTCVISHGPNPRTTHIFDNCIVESCCGVRKLREKSCKSCKVDHTDKGKDI